MPNSWLRNKMNAIAEFLVGVVQCAGLALVLVALGNEPQAMGQDAYDPQIKPAGQWLGKLLDRMDVERHWLCGHAHVAWKTGLLLGGEHDTKLTPLTPGESHCSAFAAAVADNLGIYLLHPPEHSHVLLANAQHDWLASDAGRKAGWRPLDTPLAAQQAANRGALVVAAFKNPDATQPGHIAVVRPSDAPASRIKEVGPQVTQAGATNYRSVDLQTGFRRHPGAWAPGGAGAVKFYVHEVDAAKLAGE